MSNNNNQSTTKTSTETSTGEQDLRALVKSKYTITLSKDKSNNNYVDISCNDFQLSMLRSDVYAIALWMAKGQEIIHCDGFTVKTTTNGCLTAAIEYDNKGPSFKIDFYEFEELLQYINLEVYHTCGDDIVYKKALTYSSKCNYNKDLARMHGFNPMSTDVKTNISVSYYQNVTGYEDDDFYTVRFHNDHLDIRFEICEGMIDNNTGLLTDFNYKNTTITIEKKKSDTPLIESKNWNLSSNQWSIEVYQYVSREIVRLYYLIHGYFLCEKEVTESEDECKLPSKYQDLINYLENCNINNSPVVMKIVSSRISKALESKGCKDSLEKYNSIMDKLTELNELCEN